MPPPVARSAALSLYRQYLRTAARVPKLHVRVSTRRTVRMAFRTRAYDYLVAAGGDSGTAAAEASAEVWIREGREDLGTFLFCFIFLRAVGGGEEVGSHDCASQMCGTMVTVLERYRWPGSRYTDELLLSGRPFAGGWIWLTYLACVGRVALASASRCWLCWPPPLLPWFPFLFFTVCLVHFPTLTGTWQALVQMEPAALNAVLFPEPVPAPRSSDAFPNGHTEART